MQAEMLDSIVSSNSQSLFDFNAEHNGEACIESLDPKDHGTERQYGLYTTVKLDEVGQTKVLYWSNHIYICTENIECDEAQKLSVKTSIRDDRGEELSSKVREELSEKTWAHMKDIVLSLDDWDVLMERHNEYILTQTRFQGYLARVTLFENYFDLLLYNEYAVSVKSNSPRFQNSKNVSRRLYLGLHHIIRYWGMGVLQSKLGFKGSEPVHVSLALGKHFTTYCDTRRKELEGMEHTGALRAEMRYRMVDKDLVPESWRDGVPEKNKQVAFYPYTTLKCLGLPPVAYLEQVQKEKGFKA